MTITEFLEARVAEDEYVANRELLLGTTTPLTKMNARVLDECVAKRAIIAEWEDPTTFQTWGSEVDDGYVIAIDKAVRALAAIYADHPNYQQDWAL